MSFELVYTSARKGLRVGASGFCTVAATEGIPRTLQDKLESLSGYRHEESFAGLEPPVNHAHATIRIQRKIYHVLSRISNAAKDHTGRSNKIAHHLALTSSELEQFADGPVAMFSDTAFWIDHWDSEPTQFQPDRLPEVYSGAADDFSTWEQVFGDAGWAGILGEAVSDGFKSVSIIVPDNADALPLLSEALQLVKPENRWKVCFSTYFARQVSGTQCHWRVALDGTSEARKLRSRAQGLLVDPLGSSTSMPDNAFVRAAQEGRPDRVHEMASSADRRRISIQQAPVEESESADTDDEVEDRPVRPSVRRRQEARKKQQRPLESVSPFDVSEDEYAHVSIDGRKSNGKPPTGKKRRGRRKKQKPAVIIVMVLGLTVIAILAFLGIKSVI